MGGHVHEVYVFGLRLDEFSAAPAGNQLANESSLLVELGVRLGDGVLLLLEHRVEGDLAGDRAALDLAVGSLDKPELVDPRISGKRGDQTDIWPFRRLDRADSAVMGGMDVPHFESRPLPRDPARPQPATPPALEYL